jgi:hypothetical protein
MILRLVIPGKTSITQESHINCQRFSEAFVFITNTNLIILVFQKLFRKFYESFRKPLNVNVNTTRTI